MTNNNTLFSKNLDSSQESELQHLKYKKELSGVPLLGNNIYIYI